jgi:hypothetical protein
MSRTLITLLVVATTCNLVFSQTPSDIRVRVLDYRNGRPTQGRKVGLLIGPGGARNDKWLVAKTDRQGLASFRITGPLPQILSVDPEGGVLANWSCTRGVLDLETSRVLQRGFVAEFTDHPFCQHHTSVIPPARPGEIVVYTRHLNAWWTFRRFMHEAFHG